MIGKALVLAGTVLLSVQGYNLANHQKLSIVTVKPIKVISINKPVKGCFK